MPRLIRYHSSGLAIAQDGKDSPSDYVVLGHYDSVMLALTALLNQRQIDNQKKERRPVRRQRAKKR